MYKLKETYPFRVSEKVYFGIPEEAYLSQPQLGI
jgi:hypothetical protein